MAELCDRCGERICEHGFCYCPQYGDGFCRLCARRKQLEYEAEREAAFQRDVIGPLFGWKNEDKDK